jgi:hypothetical protein
MGVQPAQTQPNVVPIAGVRIVSGLGGCSGMAVASRAG